jgi:hypothetical protein
MMGMNGSSLPKIAVIGDKKRHSDAKWVGNQSNELSKVKESQRKGMQGLDYASPLKGNNANFHFSEVAPDGNAKTKGSSITASKQGSFHQQREMPSNIHGGAPHLNGEYLTEYTDNYGLNSK